MPKVDDLKRILGLADDPETDSKKEGERLHCPYCGTRLSARESKTRDTGTPARRFACPKDTALHYRTRWHRTWAGALAEMLRGFQNQ